VEEGTNKRMSGSGGGREEDRSASFEARRGRRGKDEQNLTPLELQRSRSKECIVSLILDL